MALSDVVIIGAGPAGTSAALMCRQRGLKICLVAPSPSENAGYHIETLHGSAFSVLEQLDLLHIIGKSSLGPAEPFYREGVLIPPVDDLTMGQHVDREKLDASLLSKAIANGAQYINGRVAEITLTQPKTVTIKLQNGNMLQSRWVIDARGRVPFSAKLVPSKQELLSPPLMVVTGVYAGQAMKEKGASFSYKKWGWLWHSYLTGGQVAWTALYAADANAPGQVEKLKAQSIRQSLRQTSSTWFIRHSAPDRVLLAGDAAGALDPASGKGMLNAILSGIACGNIIAQSIENQTSSSQAKLELDVWWQQYLLTQADALTEYYAAAQIG